MMNNLIENLYFNFDLMNDNIYNDEEFVKATLLSYMCEEGV